MTLIHAHRKSGFASTTVGFNCRAQIELGIAGVASLLWNSIAQAMR